MALSTLSLPSIDPFMWHVILPFPVGLMASRLLFGRAKGIARRSQNFSPMVASILATPILAVAYYLLVAVYYADLTMSLVGLVLCAPILVPLLPLLLIYLRGGFRRKRIYGFILSAISVVVVILWFVGLFILGLAFADR